MSARDSFKLEKLAAHSQTNIQNEANLNTVETEINKIQYSIVAKLRFDEG